ALERRRVRGPGGRSLRDLDGGLPQPGEVLLSSATINGRNVLTPAGIRDISYSEIEFVFEFSQPLDPQNYQTYFSFSPAVPVTYSLDNDNRRVTVKSSATLDYYAQYLPAGTNPDFRRHPPGAPEKRLCRRQDSLKPEPVADNGIQWPESYGFLPPEVSC
ncbi:MAG: Ig-like domain-containing protein, partial [Bacteroidales bacterium]